MAETAPDEWKPLSQGTIKEENQTVIRATKHGAGSEERNKVGQRPDRQEGEERWRESRAKREPKQQLPCEDARSPACRLIARTQSPSVRGANLSPCCRTPPATPRPRLHGSQALSSLPTLGSGCGWAAPSHPLCSQWARAELLVSPRLDPGVGAPAP